MQELLWMERTESVVMPSPVEHDSSLSMFTLYRKRAMTAEARLAVEHMIATNPATRAMLSNPGRETKVTEALKIMAACRARDISG